MEKKKFIVAVSETLNRLVAVEAESMDEALDLAYEKWHDGTIVLDADDVVEGADVYPYEKCPTKADLEICKNFIRKNV